MEDKKFIASYSGGKDSVLAIYRAIQKGYKPICLLTTYDEKNEHSWFHHVPTNLLEEVSEALGIPLLIVKTEGENYADNFETALAELKTKGADMCIFGDIDIQEHFDWCAARCNNVGLESFFPLWQEDRKSLVHEFIASGFYSKITVLDATRMNEKYLGETLTSDIVEQIALDGTDVCGENGEYHTFVYDGPIFSKRIEFEFGEIMRAQNYVRLPIKKIF